MSFEAIETLKFFVYAVSKMEELDEVIRIKKRAVELFPVAEALVGEQVTLQSTLSKVSQLEEQLSLMKAKIKELSEEKRELTRALSQSLESKEPLILECPYDVAVRHVGTVEHQLTIFNKNQYPPAADAQLPQVGDEVVWEVTKRYIDGDNSVIEMSFKIKKKE